jgi:hypothetical protein
MSLAGFLAVIVSEPDPAPERPAAHRHPERLARGGTAPRLPTPSERGRRRSTVWR